MSQVVLAQPVESSSLELGRRPVLTEILLRRNAVFHGREVPSDW